MTDKLLVLRYDPQDTYAAKYVSALESKPGMADLFVAMPYGVEITSFPTDGDTEARSLSLQMAVGLSNHSSSPSKVLEKARLFYDFITGTSEKERPDSD